MLLFFLTFLMLIYMNYFALNIEKGRMSMGKMFYNLICEELCITGGKVIYIDTNVGSLEEVHKIVTDNADKYPNGKWEL